MWGPAAFHKKEDTLLMGLGGELSHAVWWKQMVFNKKGCHGCLDFNNIDTGSFPQKCSTFCLFLKTHKEWQMHRDFAYQQGQSLHPRHRKGLLRFVCTVVGLGGSSVVVFVTVHTWSPIPIDRTSGHTHRLDTPFLTVKTCISRHSINALKLQRKGCLLTYASSSSFLELHITSEKVEGGRLPFSWMQCIKYYSSDLWSSFNLIFCGFSFWMGVIHIYLSSFSGFHEQLSHGSFWSIHFEPIILPVQSFLDCPLPHDSHLFVLLRPLDPGSWPYST